MGVQRSKRHIIEADFTVGWAIQAEEQFEEGVFPLPLGPTIAVR